MKAKTYQGKVCAKHPELKGLRHRSTRHCPKCKREYSLRWRAENPERHLATKRRYRQKDRELDSGGARRGLVNVTAAYLLRAWVGLTLDAKPGILRGTR